MTLGERIRDLRKEKNLTQAELGEILGVQQSAIRKYEYGEINIPLSKLEAMSNYFEVMIEYLLGKSDWRTQEELQAQLAEWDEKYNKGVAPITETTKFEHVFTKLPMYNAAVSAGTGTWLDDGCEYEFVEFENAPSGADFALRVRGDSMEPMYSDGDIVFVKAGVIVESGQIGVFCLNDEGYLKMLQGNKLVSLNPKYKPITVGEFDNFLCAGRVVGKN
ncbi:MAG: XRE family transcriptional regulator [Oscillospiraceae bacterium]|jgi:phage repressor protein C with HTH and peptisase S24 domain|nr:XRE family transcriptional regulator [Oscillospiraceae bacterium]